MSELSDVRVDTIPLETKIKRDKEQTQTTRQQIRGSGLFVIGRLLTVGTSFLTQVMIVRYLAKTDYGAFAYALSLVNSIETIVTLGLDRAITRFLPIYDEQKDYARMLGTILFVIVMVLSVSVGIILLFFGFQGFVAARLVTDTQAVILLSILIFLSPLQALSNIINGMFAVLSSPRAIFFRRYIFGPGLQMVVIVLMVVTKQFTKFLAMGYTISGLVVVVFFGIWLYRVMQKEKLFDHVGLRQIRFPVKEVLAFTIPLLASDALYMAMGTINNVILEHYHDTQEIASLGAVLPVAKMNQLVLATFGLLYTPAAARLFARRDKEGINSLYWQNTVWTAVLTFPIFALTFSFARPLTLLLFQERYASSSTILAWLAIGYYFDALLGQNGLTLKVMGKLRYVTIIYLVAAVISVALNFLFIPKYGALGAAIATAVTLILFNLLKQGGLLLGTGISLLDPRYRSMYLSIIAATVVLVIVQAYIPSMIVGFVLAGTVSLAVVWLNRRLLDARNTFPELMKFPFVSWLLK